MQVQNVEVKNKGANVHYNGTAQPTYYSTNNDGKNDRVVINFGFLRVNMLDLAIVFSFCNQVIVSRKKGRRKSSRNAMQAGLICFWHCKQLFEKRLNLSLASG